MSKKSNWYWRSMAKKYGKLLTDGSAANDGQLSRLRGRHKTVFENAVAPLVKRDRLMFQRLLLHRERNCLSDLFERVRNFE